MKFDLNLFFILCVQFICSIICYDFECPKGGKIGGSKVPNVLNLIDKQTGYRAFVEVVHPLGKKSLHDYYNAEKQAGFIDMEAIVQDKMNRHYYYHQKRVKFTIRDDIYCNSKELNQDQKIEMIKDWFLPNDIVESSDIFKDLDLYLGPTVLMIYANKISDKVSFVGSELIEGRSVNHWFYCGDPEGPCIEFYFDVETSLPYKFSLYYPQLIEVEGVNADNQTQTVKKQVTCDRKYIYNFYSFEPLVLSSSDQVPYPLDYSCWEQKYDKKKPLPKFGQADKFSMDMEALITYSDGEVVRSSARVMKLGEIISYEFKEGQDFVRYIEMPPPLGHYIVYPKTGSCYLKVPDYSKDIYGRKTEIITSWPLKKDCGFNLLEYLVMKPKTGSFGDTTTSIADENLGPFRVERYDINNFFFTRADALITYYYPMNTTKDFIPNRITFAPSDSQTQFVRAPDKVEVTIINYSDDNFDYEDRFDVSGCYQESGSFTWFQLLFSNPWETEYNVESIKEQMKESLISFIPIFRIGPIHVQQVVSNIYVTIKLYDRLPFINAYRSSSEKLAYPDNILKLSSREECEQVCTSSNVEGSSRCNAFSFCDNFDCLIDKSSPNYDPIFDRDYSCTSYHRERAAFEISSFVQNYLSPMANVLQQIRNKVSSGSLRFANMEEMFIVNGPEEIGDISNELIMRPDSSTPLRAEDFPLIIKDRRLNKPQIKIGKITLNDCFMACLNDDDCNTLSYCNDEIKECILSNETSSSLKDTITDKTSHADGCNIYEKSFMNLFHEYTEKILILDAISNLSSLSVAECAKTCVQSNEFDCESFDYCKKSDSRNESVCFLHVNHIAIDNAHLINVSNWKQDDSGCSHYSKKSELDYAHKLGFGLKDADRKSIIANYEFLSLEFCASKCNLNSNCHIFEFCQNTDYSVISDSNHASTSCSLTNLKPNDVTLSKSIEPLKSDTKICSIYIKHMKVTGKNETETQSYDEPESFEMTGFPAKSNHNLNLAMGLSTILFILAFAVGFIGFKFAVAKGFLN